MDAIILESEALSLSPLERARLADKLLNSLSDPIHDPVLSSWTQLAEKRLSAYERGELSCVDGPSTLTELRASLAQ